MFSSNDEARSIPDRRSYEAIMAARAEARRILGLSEGASQEQIMKQYKKLAKQCHPDKALGDRAAATERFAALGNAKDELLNPAPARPAYMPQPEPQRHYQQTYSYETPHYSGFWRNVDAEAEFERRENERLRREMAEMEKMQGWFDPVEDEDEKRENARLRREMAEMEKMQGWFDPVEDAEEKRENTRLRR